MNNYLALLQNPYILVPILIWSGVWKGFALWRATRLNQKIWYVCILLINTLGILEILYLYIFSRPKNR